MSLVNDGLITGVTEEERDRSCRDLLSELAGRVIDIFRVEKARSFIDKAGNRHPGYRLRVRDGETPPPTNGECEPPKE